MRVKVLFSVPTTYEVEFNPKDFEYEMDRLGKDYKDVAEVGDWFEEHAPRWLMENGEIMDLDYEDLEVLEAIEIK